MEDVVENDLSLEIGQAALGGTRPPRKKRTLVADRTPRSPSVISAPRNPSRPPPTSVRLHEDELAALKSMAAGGGARSVSDLVQRAVRDYVSANGGFTAPGSLGVVDGVYGATMHDDIVELANLLRMLEFGLLRIMDLLQPSKETSELRRTLEDADRTLTRMAGRVAYRPKIARSMKG